MAETVYITGHKNPDSDSICSSIAYAEFKNKFENKYIPVRQGKLNQETEFILKYFNVPAPEYIETVKTQVSDLNIDKAVHVSKDVSIKTAWMIIQKYKIKTLPIVDKNERLIGIVTLSDITKKYMDTNENNMIAKSNTTLKNIIETINGNLVFGCEQMLNTSGKVVITAMSTESLGPFISKNDIVITGDREDVQIASIELGANVLIITGNPNISKSTLDKAKESNCILITTNYDTYTTSRLISQSVPVEYVMTTEKIVSFNLDDFIDEIKDKMLQTRYRSYPVVDDNNKVKGLISRYHLISQNKKKVILLDHNEKSQSVDGIEEADIIEIIDHHRVGDIETKKPIYFINRPVGSTATIIANLYFENSITPTKKTAGLMCAAILSDTLKFKSPTSTHVDKITANKLAEIAGIDIDDFAQKMFKAGTSLKGKTPEEIFYQDFKDFNLSKYKIGIGQVTTMDLSSIEKMKEPIIEYMKIVCKDKDYDLLVLMLTDIINEGSELLYVGSRKELIPKAFNINSENNSIYLPGVVSRKTQVVPPLSTAAMD